jgi:isoleucyl-tRNA synthetase
VAGIVAKNEAVVAGKVLAERITENETFAVSKEWNVNGEKVTISIEKI